jgi:hypothetical protein
MLARHAVQPMESAMRSYINHENVRRYRKLIAISEGDPCRNEARHQTLVRLLAEEEAKEKEPKDLPAHA